MNARPEPAGGIASVATPRQGLRLGDASHGHDNNLNLLRLLAALLVLLSHSFTVATGNSALEPGRSVLGVSLGDISVDVFFAISGFLVTKSICRSGDLRKYAVARALRILPGLWVALLLTTVVVCVFFSAGEPAQRLAQSDTWRYVLKNGAVLVGTEFRIDGAFPGNPYPATVNASLWTLPLEVWMYVGLAVAWVVAGRALRRWRGAFARLICASAVALMAGALLLDALHHPSSSLRHAAVFFFAAMMYCARDRIVLNRWAVVAAIVAMAAAAIGPHALFELVYRPLVAYVVLYAAFVPAGFVRRYNALGDYSYGVYIYAFPLQQMVAAAVPGISTASLFALSGLLTIACGVLSWKLVEERALRLRARLEHRRPTPHG